MLAVFSTAPQFEPTRQLMAGIVADVEAILVSFAGGPSDPKNPIVNDATLRADKARLDAATNKAEQLSSELSRLKGEAGGRGD